MEIRRLSARDASEVYEIMKFSARDRSSWDTYIPREEAFASGFTDFAVTNETYGVFIDDVLACIFWFMPITGRIMSCHTTVAPAFRGKGLLKGMITLRNEIASDKGWPLSSYVPAYNEPMWKTLEKCGHRLINVIPKAHGFGENLSDVRVYHKDP